MKNVIGKIVRLTAIVCVCGSLSALSAFGDDEMQPFEVDGTGYPTLESAVGAASANGTVRIMVPGDRVLDKTLVIDKNLTIQVCVDGAVLLPSSNFDGDCLFKVCDGAEVTLSYLYADVSAANSGKTITCSTGDVVPYGGTRFATCEGSGELTFDSCTVINHGCSVNGAIVLAKDFTGTIALSYTDCYVSTSASGGIVSIEGDSDVTISEFSVGIPDGIVVQGNGGLLSAFGNAKLNVSMMDVSVYRNIEVGGNGGLFYLGKNVSGNVDLGNLIIDSYDGSWVYYIQDLMGSQAYDPRQESWRTSWNTRVHSKATSGPASSCVTAAGVGNLGFYWDNGKVTVTLDGEPMSDRTNAQWNYNIRSVSSADLALAADYAARNAVAGDVDNLTVPANDPAVFGSDGLYREIDAAITDNGMLAQHVTLECPSRSAIALAYLYGEGDLSPVNTVVINVTDSAYDKGLYLNGFYEKSSVPNGSGGLTKTFVRYKGIPKARLVSESGEITFGTDLRTGTRTIEAMNEILPFAHSVNAWGEASAAEQATISYRKDGAESQTMGEYADADVATWSPTKNGTYVFTHTPGSGLTATFNVVLPFTGSGTEEDPYVVTSANGLRQVAELGGWVRLGADIGSDATLSAELALYLDLYGRKLSGTIINNGTLTLLDGVGGGDPSALTISGSGTVIDNMVKIDGLSFKQRYPWNGLVDISYTISGMLPEKTYAVRFMVTAGETTKTFETTNLVNGVNTYVWDAAASSAFGLDVVADASVKAQIYCTSKKEVTPQKTVCCIGVNEFSSVQAAVDSLADYAGGDVPEIVLIADASAETLDLSTCTTEFFLDYAERNEYGQMKIEHFDWLPTMTNCYDDYYCTDWLYDTWWFNFDFIFAAKVWYHHGIVGNLNTRETYANLQDAINGLGDEGGALERLVYVPDDDSSLQQLITANGGTKPFSLWETIDGLYRAEVTPVNDEWLFSEMRDQSDVYTRMYVHVHTRDGGELPDIVAFEDLTGSAYVGREIVNRNTMMWVEEPEEHALVCPVHAALMDFGGVPQSPFMDRTFTFKLQDYGDYSDWVWDVEVTSDKPMEPNSVAFYMGAISPDEFEVYERGLVHDVYQYENPFPYAVEFMMEEEYGSFEANTPYTIMNSIMSGTSNPLGWDGLLPQGLWTYDLSKVYQLVESGFAIWFGACNLSPDNLGTTLTYRILIYPPVIDAEPIELLTIEQSLETTFTFGE